MCEKDFSLREEIKDMLKKLDLEMDKKQIDAVVEAVELNETFLGVVAFFTLKGITEIAECDALPLDEEKVQKQMDRCILSMDAKDLPI